MKLERGQQQRMILIAIKKFYLAVKGMIGNFVLISLKMNLEAFILRW